MHPSTQVPDYMQYYRSEGPPPPPLPFFWFFPRRISLVDEARLVCMYNYLLSTLTVVWGGWASPHRRHHRQHQILTYTFYLLTSLTVV